MKQLLFLFILALGIGLYTASEIGDFLESYQISLP